MKTASMDIARVEKAVGVAAGLCGIHCLITPVLVAGVPFLALSETVEWGLMVVTVSLGLGMVLFGPFRSPRLVRLGLMAGAGVWLSSLLGWFEPWPEPVTSATGSLVFAGSLIWSARACRTGACEVCGDAECQTR